jgi:hypothetical protein
MQMHEHVSDSHVCVLWHPVTTNPLPTKGERVLRLICEVPYVAFLRLAVLVRLASRPASQLVSFS